MKRLFLALIAGCLSFSATAHIGSPAVTFEGKAGAHSILVLVTPPDVIPGTATVDIYTKTSGIGSVWAKPVYWYAGDEGTPTADEMVPVDGEPGHYRGIIWLMRPGTSGIDIEVRGAEGDGRVLVPVMAVSTAQREMPSSLGWSLFILCLLLVGLMVTIISASVSDSLVKINEDVAKVRRKRWIGAAVSTVLLLLILWGGNSWWDGWSSRYKRLKYKPLSATSTISTVSGNNVLNFKIDARKLPNLINIRKISMVVPDHGKLMHLFLVKAESMDVFAHLHPKRKDSLTYVAPLPPLPQGKYLVFADITRLSGFAETITDTLEIENKIPVVLASMDSSLSNRDDTYFVTNAISKPGNESLLKNIVICGKPGVKTTLADGSTATWEHETDKPFEAGKLYELAFAMEDEKGKPSVLEPYLGMMGHAVIMKNDGSVYIHLHPAGSYSMASQETMLTRFEKETGPVNWSRIAAPAIFMDSVNQLVARLDALPEDERNKILMGDMYHAPEDTTAHAEHAVVKFPYAFPSPGSYRIWIQMKRNGKILNSAFDAEVE